MPFWRKSNPETSKEAALSIKPERLSRAKQSILSLLYVPMTDEALLEAYNTYASAVGADWISPSGLRSRRSELVAAGLVEDTGERMRLKSGRNAIVWGLVK